MSVNKVFFGDCRESMRRLIAEGVKVQMCVTSPPYWGLRDYGTATWDGGDELCDHKIVSDNTKAAASSGLEGSTRNCRNSLSGFKATCPKCGARRIDKQLGLEETPEEYVNNMVEVFRLVRELLADDGVLWLNLGDSYAASRSYQFPDNKHPAVGCTGHDTRAKKLPSGLKQKDLVGIPWQVAFALQADGWYLRQDIIWHKPNPMPESVTDRCTKAHEYMFLFSKSARYYFDADAIKEKAIYPGDNRGLRTDARRGTECNSMNGKTGDSRNKRSVWTVATKPYSEAHFATFPPKLIEPCVLAGSRADDIVLDPFFGSGTTGEVAQKLGRQWIGCELNPEYEPLQQQRTAQMGFALRSPVDQGGK